MVKRKKNKKSYGATIDAWGEKTEARKLAIFQASTEQLINEANLPVAKGGNMRVDTGFMRASGQISLDGLPTGPVRGEQDQTYSTDDTIIQVEISKARLGDHIFFGWTANYARVREHYDGFLKLAVQRWPKIVASIVKREKARRK